ncbi:hypothetical protein Adt_04196 [Abeliophyllum distichum]|uniref:Uncharacterized protein n=1 Tax=Abeliophyllum distichum TaxID=126358 RepID=A0ABD1W2R2_9LAMI
MRKITGHEADGKQQKLFPSLPLRPSFFTSAKEAFTEDGFQLRQRGPVADSPAVSQGFLDVAKGSLCRQSRRAGATGSREGQSRSEGQSRREGSTGSREGRGTGSRAKEGKSYRQSREGREEQSPARREGLVL